MLQINQANIRTWLIVRDNAISCVIAVKNCWKRNCHVWWALEARLTLPSSQNSNFGNEV